MATNTQKIMDQLGLKKKDIDGLYLLDQIVICKIHIHHFDIVLSRELCL